MTPNLLTCAAAAHDTVVAKLRLCEPRLVPTRTTLLKDLDIVVVVFTRITVYILRKSIGLSVSSLGHRVNIGSGSSC